MFLRMETTNHKRGKEKCHFQLPSLFRRISEFRNESNLLYIFQCCLLKIKFICN